MTDRYYIVNQRGMATLCADQADAVAAALDADLAFPNGAPHRAVQMVELSADGPSDIEMLERVIGRNARGDYVAPNARAIIRIAMESGNG